MEYLESTREALALDNFDLLEMAWYPPQISIVTLMQLRHVLWTKMQLAMSEIKDPQYNDPECVIFKTSHKIPGHPS